jgi:hypothetical protein
MGSSAWSANSIASSALRPRPRSHSRAYSSSSTRLRTRTLLQEGKPFFDVKDLCAERRPVERDSFSHFSTHSSGSIFVIAPDA